MTEPRGRGIPASLIGHAAPEMQMAAWQASPAGPAPASAAGRLLAGFSDAELLSCGVPAALLPAVRALRTDEDLDGLTPYLPDEAADALVLLAAGGTVAEALAEAEREPASVAVDTDDFAKALEHPDSRRRFKVIGGEHELAEMLAAPLAQWRVFLHPTQRKLVEMKASGPVRVLGGPGAGKTVVAMHRARHLAATVFDGKDDRVLVTTFTRNLARDLERQLRTLCGPEAERVEVANLHLWAVRFMRRQGVTFDILTRGAEQKALWEQALAEAASDIALPTSFYRDEWEKVVQAHDVTERAGYLAISRRGRGVPLTRRQRGEVWQVFAAYREALQAAGKVEWADVVRETRLYLERHPGALPYRAVVADEVQDFRPADLRLLRALAPEGTDSLFVVGDAHQRIYGHKASLTACGIAIRGRSRRLKLNYRTTARIRALAVSVLRGLAVDDLDEGQDTLRGYRSLRVGTEPEVRHFATPEDEEAFLIARLRAWIAEAPAEEICLVARTRSIIENRYRPLLTAAGLPATVIDADSEGDPSPGIRLATMHRVKGLEFPRMVLVSVQQDLVPQPLHDAADAASLEDHLDQERRLLFVAMTRARDELVIIGYGAQCPLLP